MKYFFSCDWGTSAFRLRLINAENERVVSTIKTSQGIASTFKKWKELNQPEENRLAFYQSYLVEQIKNITDISGDDFIDMPVILSGMASSSIGMIELPYRQIPFACDGTGLVLHTIAGQVNKIIIISGARSDVDVIRGEETMLAGCDLSIDDNDQLLIFPGTHSKHILVKKGQVKNITTYMTGELFDLLSNKSILSASVKKNENGGISDSRFFIQGVKEGAANNLLNSIFHVRTNQLFNKADPVENFNYLSGLLIGQELKDISETKQVNSTLVCGEDLKELYMQALNILEANDINYRNADEALVTGQLKILKQLNQF